MGIPQLVFGKNSFSIISRLSSDGIFVQGSHFSGLTKFPDFSSIFFHFPVLFLCSIFLN